MGGCSHWLFRSTGARGVAAALTGVLGFIGFIGIIGFIGFIGGCGYSYSKLCASSSEIGIDHKCAETTLKRGDEIRVYFSERNQVDGLFKSWEGADTARVLIVDTRSRMWTQERGALAELRVPLSTISRIERRRYALPPSAAILVVGAILGAAFVFLSLPYLPGD